MADQSTLDIYAELHRRNAVPPEHKPVVDELVRRGVIGGKKTYGPGDTLEDGTVLDDQGLERGNVLPIARDPNTNTLSLAVPGLIYKPFQAFRESAKTGTVTPEQAVEMAGLGIAGKYPRTVASPNETSRVWGPGIRRAQQAGERAAEFDAVGVPTFGPALSEAAAGPANALMSGFVGAPLRQGAQASIGAVERGVQDVIGTAGARRPVNEIGTEAQDFLRRQIVERDPSVLPAEMTAFELQDISGVGPGPRAPRTAPPVTPTRPEPWNPQRRQVTPDEVERAMPPVERIATPQPKQIGLDEVPLPAELARRVEDTRAAAEAAQTWLAQEAEPRLNDLQSQFYSGVGLHPARAEELGRPLSINSPAGQAWNEYKSLRPIVEKARQAVKDHAEAAAAAQDYRSRAWKGVQDAELARVSADAETNYQLRIAEARRATEENLNRVADAEYQNNLNDPARRTEFENRARNAARFDTERRQNAANTAYLAELEQRQAAAIPDSVGGRSRLPYNTEFDAGYEAARRNTPPMQTNPLGRPSDTQQTRTAELLDSIGLEYRRQGLLPGYRRGNVFDTNGRVNPDLLQIVRSLAGPGVAERMEALSAMRPKGAAQLGIQGLDEIRTAIGQALSDARQKPIGGMLQGEGASQRARAAFLSRLYNAIGQDVDAAVAQAPGGGIAAQQRTVLRQSYKQFMTEIRAPLSKIFGEKTTPEQAVRLLTDAAQGGDRGNLDLLRAYFQVAEQKGDRVRATGAILNQMAHGGLGEFLTRWREMPPEVKGLVFRGETEFMGRQLDQLARVGGYLERFVPNAAPASSAMDVARRTASTQNVMTALIAYFNAPTAIALAAGQATASKVMASNAFRNWLVRIPQARTESERTAMIRRLGQIVASQSGNGEAGKRISQDLGAY